MCRVPEVRGPCGGFTTKAPMRQAQGRLRIRRGEGGRGKEIGWSPRPQIVVSINFRPSNPKTRNRESLALLWERKKTKTSASVANS